MHGGAQQQRGIGTRLRADSKPAAVRPADDESVATDQVVHSHATLLAGVRL
jgi:hypothetical protein